MNRRMFVKTAMATTMLGAIPSKPKECSRQLLELTPNPFAFTKKDKLISECLFFDYRMVHAYHSYDESMHVALCHFSTPYKRSEIPGLVIDATFDKWVYVNHKNHKCHILLQPYTPYVDFGEYDPSYPYPHIRSTRISVPRRVNHE